MSGMQTLYRALLGRFRQRRMDLLQAAMGIAPDTRILDIGGTLYNWSLLRIRPRVLFLNRDFLPSVARAGAPFVQGDGCRLPFADMSFDVAFSNSVIEHVGGWQRQQDFAAEIRRVAPRCFVQTPERGFPLEPHFLGLFLHWLPLPVRSRLGRWLTVWGWSERPSQARAAAFARSIRLLSRQELARLFPQAEIRVERFLGLGKSLVAIS